METIAIIARRNSRGDKSKELDPPENCGGGGGAGRTVIWKTELGAPANGLNGGGGGAGSTTIWPVDCGGGDKGNGGGNGGGVEIIEGEFCIVAK